MFKANPPQISICFRWCLTTKKRFSNRLWFSGLHCPDHVSGSGDSTLHTLNQKKVTKQWCMKIADRVVCIFPAILVAVLYFTGRLTGLAVIILGILAVIFVITSFIGFRPHQQC